MGVEGHLVMAVQASAVIDPAGGAFGDPARWWDDESAAWFRAGHDVDGDTGCGGGAGDGGAGVAVVHPGIVAVPGPAAPAPRWHPATRPRTEIDVSVMPSRRTFPP